MALRFSTRLLFHVWGPMLLVVMIPVWLTWRLWRQEMLNHALIAAAEQNSPDAVLEALRCGADPNTHSSSLAARSYWQILGDNVQGKKILPSPAGYPVLIIALLPHGQSANPLHDLTVVDQQIIAALLDAGANPNIEIAGIGTPLMVAADWTNGDIVKVLLDHGVDVNTKDSQGNTALAAAGAGNNISSARTLIAYGADINSNVCGFTALWCSIQNQNVQLQQLLLRHHANPFIQTPEGETPISLAKRLRFTTALRIFQQLKVKLPP